MQFAFYFGDHKDDGFRARLGYALIKAGQIKEHYGKYTHCEAIMGRVIESEKVVIASASVRDGNQVRLKAVKLNPSRWLILDCPQYSLQQSLAWFIKNRRTPYSMLGAVASTLWIARLLVSAFGIETTSLGQWCSRCISDSIGIQGGADFNVSELITLLVNMPDTKDITKEFFAGEVAIAEFPEEYSELLFAS